MIHIKKNNFTLAEFNNKCPFALILFGQRSGRLDQMAQWLYIKNVK